MKTLKKIKNAIIETGRYIARKPLETILITALSAGVVSCKPNDKDPIFFPNQAPVILTTNLPDAVENSTYSTTISADDPESDPITYLIIGGTADTFLEINSSTGGLYNDIPITDAESGTIHDITIKAEDDNGNYTEKTFNLNIINTEIVTGNVRDVTDDTDLSNIEVKVGSYIDTTDINGDYTITNMLDGNYDVEINDTTGSETDYLTHKAGKLIVNKTKNLEGKLSNINFKLIPATLNQEFKREILYWDSKNSQLGPIRKWENNKPSTIYFWTTEFPTGTPLDPAEVTEVINIINELSQFSQDATGLNIIVSDIEPPWSTNGYMIVWADSIMGATGSNAQTLEGNKIIYSSVKFRPGCSKAVKRQELTESLVDGAESELEPSVLNNSPASNDYLPIDLLMGKIFDNRPMGNEDKNISDNHDVNPAGYIINP